MPGARLTATDRRRPDQVAAALSDECDELGAAAIRQVAERFGADFICVASHGRSGLSRR